MPRQDSGREGNRSPEVYQAGSWTRDIRPPIVTDRRTDTGQPRATNMSGASQGRFYKPSIIVGHQTVLSSFLT